MKKIFLISILLVFLASCAFSQEFAIDKGSIMFSGTTSFSSYGGDLYDSGDKRDNTLTISPSASYFVLKGFFAGANIGFTNSSQGSWSVNSISAGPLTGYAFGNAESKLFPYLATAFRYTSESGDISSSGTVLSIGGGLITLGSEHLGLVIEAAYNIVDKKEKNADKSVSGNVISVGCGISGFWF